MILLALTGIIVNLVFACWFLFVAKRNIPADKYLGIIFLSFFFTFLFNYYEFSGFADDFPGFLFMDMGLPFIIGPLFWIYVQKLTNRNASNYFIHFVPALLIYFFLVDIIFLPPDEKIRLLRAPASSESIRYQVVTILQLIPVPVYLIFSISGLSQYNKRLKKAYSAVDKLNHHWLKTILILFLCFWTGMSAGIISINFLNDTETGMILFMAVLLVFAVLTGIYGMKRNLIIGILPDDRTQKSENKIKPAVNIRDFVCQNKNYLQAELTLYQLANELKMPAHTLSRSLKQNYHTSFFEFINQLRIDEFKNRIAAKDHKKYSILAIAYDCGFNSKSAFYRFFNKSENCSPKEYIRKVEL